MKLFLGINAFSHNSSASIVSADGHVIAAVEEERFTRKKRESRFPEEAVRYCLRTTGVNLDDVSAVVFAWHPISFALERILWSDLVHYRVRRSVLQSHIRQLTQFLSVGHHLMRCSDITSPVRVRYARHHFAHAASAYYPSPFDRAAYLTLDGRGELQAISWGKGEDAQLSELGCTYFPNSVGKIYSAVSRFLGFEGADKDGTVMALAACGEPRFLNEFKQMLSVDVRKGLHGVRLCTKYFDLQDVALPSSAMERLLGVSIRRPDEPIRQDHKDVAASLQRVTQDTILYLLSELHKVTRLPDLVMAGGVALNSVANGIILERTPFQRVFIQPAAHDGGLSLGAACLAAHQGRSGKLPCSMGSSDLGPEFTDQQISMALVASTISQEDAHIEKPPQLAKEIARRLADGEIVACFQGRMEFGPRALGYRSLLADPRRAELHQRLNKIKGRESFRPVAIAILHEEAKDWLCRAVESPFMLFVDHFRGNLGDRVPAALHVDGSVRIQTVRAETNPLFYNILQEFFDLTGVPLVLNTSLNLRGEPLVCTPEDALCLFQRADIDSVAIGSYVVSRTRVTVCPGFSQMVISD